MKKKMVVEFNIPEGATHYERHEDKYFGFWCKYENNIWYYKSETNDNWYPYGDIGPINIQTIVFSNS